METSVQQDKPRVFNKVRARYVVIAWLLPYTPGLDWLLAELGTDWTWYWWSVTYFWVYHVLCGAALAALVFAWRLPIRECFGRRPTRSELIDGVQLTAFVFLVSTAALYVTIYPVSFIAPDVVQRAYIDTAPVLIYFDGTRYPLLPNLLQMLSLCVAAPVLEETAFRGIILPRWSYKWGVGTGMLASSALFAVMHADPLGAFLFGLAMCALYLRTQSLLLPMLCHGLYNFGVWLSEVAYVRSYGPESLYTYTLEAFQAGWPWGLGAAVLAAVWMGLYLKRPKNSVRWTLPVT